MEVEAFRGELEGWLDDHAVELAPSFPGAGSLEQQLAQLSKVKRRLFDDGWMQWGWPERAGGSGGSTLLRAVLGEAVTDRDLVQPGYFSMTEVLAPTVVDFGSTELAAAFLPRILSGDEMWCQGFSEPGTGSDLSSLACRATPQGDDWVVNGQKLWTSLSQYSRRCVLLTRTGTPESRHRGITAFFVDMDTPGITVRPFSIISGDDEFAEVFFDDVRISSSRMLGTVDGGWKVAMSLLPYERSSCFWHRTAHLRGRLGALVEHVEADRHAETVIGEAFVALYALRARSHRTQHRLAAGQQLGPETSVDKVLVAAAEQRLFDAARELLPAGTVELAADSGAQRWRDGYLYSRAATIYGGTAEVQRNIIAKRLLDLGDDVPPDLGRASAGDGSPVDRSPGGAMKRASAGDGERDLLVTTVSQVLATRRGGDGDDVLADLGWRELLVAEPDTAIAVVFDSLGRVNVRSSCLNDVVTTALGHDPEVTVVLPRYGSAGAPGVRWGPSPDPGAVGVSRAVLRADSAAESVAESGAESGDTPRAESAAESADVPAAESLGFRSAGIPAAESVAESVAESGGGVVVSGLALASAARAPTMLVVCADGQAVSVRTADLRLEAVAGIDPSLGLHTVSGSAQPVGDPTPVSWPAAVDRARVALGHEITGACRTMLALACDHARSRVQFGRPIASFQAVRHKLAEVLVAVEAAEAALEAAHHTPSPMTAALAKVLAGRAAATAGVHCQQVLAGIGFTREHEFHRHLLRTIAIDGLFGSTHTLTRDLGAGLLADRTVPRVIDL